MRAITFGAIAREIGEKMIKFSEALLMCGTALVISSHNTLGVVAMVLGTVTAFMRWSLAIHEAKQSKEAHGELFNNVSEIISDLLTSKGAKYANYRQGNKDLH